MDTSPPSSEHPPPLPALAPRAPDRRRSPPSADALPRHASSPWDLVRLGCWDGGIIEFNINNRDI